MCVGRKDPATWQEPSFLEHQKHLLSRIRWKHPSLAMLYSLSGNSAWPTSGDRIRLCAPQLMKTSDRLPFLYVRRRTRPSVSFLKVECNVGSREEDPCVFPPGMFVDSLLPRLYLWWSQLISFHGTDSNLSSSTSPSLGVYQSLVRYCVSLILLINHPWHLTLPVKFASWWQVPEENGSLFSYPSVSTSTLEYSLHTSHTASVLLPPAPAHEAADKMLLCEVCKGSVTTISFVCKTHPASDAGGMLWYITWWWNFLPQLP